MSSTISNLVAAELSQAAYANYFVLVNGATQYTNGSGQTVQLPAGWSIDLNYSAISTSNGVNQFITFVNNSTKQVVIAFKGTDNVPNGISDIYNNGSAAWGAISGDAQQALVGINGKGGIVQTYPGYAIITDGHSLGGGMAQTFALENGLPGYGQNSLPISTASVQQYLTSKGFLTLANAVSDYQFTHTFTEVNTVGDPATIYYSIGSNIAGSAYLYTPSTTTSLSGGGSFVLGELAGLAIGAIGGVALLGYSAYQAHSINTVVSLLSSGGVTAPQISVPSAQAVHAVLDASTVSSVIVNQNGSTTVTEINGTTYNIVTTANAAPPTSLTSLASGETYIFDPGTTNVAYTITGIAGVNASAIAYDPKTGGALTFTPNTTPGLKLSDGTVLNVPGGGNMQLTGVTGGTAAPEQTLVDYLAQIGDPLTAAQLDMANYNYLNPTALANMFRIDQGTRADGREQILYNYAGGSGSASPDIVGATTLTIGGVQRSVFNLVEIQNIDFAHSNLTNIQELAFFGPGAATLTLAQFTGSGIIVGTSPSDVIKAATGGTFSLVSNPNADISLTATDWSGTTLIGNNQNGEILTASLFGNDTLQAGNGTGDQLVAGEGVDTMIGGTGGDTFVVSQDLVDGSVVRGNGTGNVLKVAAGSDISGATITGVQTLSYSGSITVSLAELGEFSSIVGNGTIMVADGGTVAAGSTLKVTGVVTTPSLAISGGGIVTLQGGTLNSGPVTVNSGALMIGNGTINGAAIINGTVVSSGGTLNITGDVTGSGTLTVGSGAINLSGSSVTIASASVNAGGSLTVSGADSIANLTDNGTITVASGGTLDVSSALNPASTGIFQLTTKGSLEIAAILGAGTKFQFLGTSHANKLTIDNATKFGTNVGSMSYTGPLLESFTVGDIIDLKGISSSGLKLVYTSSTGDLQITGSTGTALATLAFQNSTLGAGSFHTASDGVGGTLITHS